MNRKEIIESGVLEEYVLGLLPENEAEEITRLCSQDPELEKEVQAIEASLVQSFSMPGTAEWKNDILQSLPTNENESTRLDSKVIPIQSASVSSNNAKSKWFWAAASFGGLFLMSAAANFILLGKNQQLSQELVDVKVKLQTETEEKSVFAANYNQIESAYQQLFSPKIQRIEMAGTPNFASNASVLYWNEETGEVIWDATSLPTLSDDKQYQLWAIVDGKPQNAGLAAAEPAQMLAVKAPQAFAVTIEPKGGSENPSLDLMVVLASVEKQTS